MKRFALANILIVLFAWSPLALRGAEKPVNFIPATPDSLVGDWQGDSSTPVAQVIRTSDGKYQATLLKAFDADGSAMATLRGDANSLSGDGWTAVLEASHLTASKDSEKIDLKHVERKPPTLDAAPSPGAIVL